MKIVNKQNVVETTFGNLKYGEVFAKNNIAYIKSYAATDTGRFQEFGVRLSDGFCFDTFCDEDVVEVVKAVIEMEYINKENEDEDN